MDDIGGQERFQDAIQSSGEVRWRDALLAVAVLASGRSAIGGLWLTARAGGVRDAFLGQLFDAMGAATPVRRLPPGTGSDALFPRLDMAATARQRECVWQDGLLAGVAGGVLLVPMAERLDTGVGAALGEALGEAIGETLADRKRGYGDGLLTSPAARQKSGFCVVALDEAAEADEAPPATLTDRLALHVSLEGIPQSAMRSALALPTRASWRDWRGVTVSDDLLEQMVSIAVSGGHRSARAHLHLLRTSRIVAALAGRPDVTPDDAVTALRLCLGIRLLSDEPSEAPPPAGSDAPANPPPEADQPPPPDNNLADCDRPNLVDDRSDALGDLEAAVRQGAVDGLSLVVSERAARQAARSGKAGGEMRNAKRGRPYAASRTMPHPDARPDIAATLRAAAPWQRLRAGRTGPSDAAASDAPNGRGGPQIRKEDFRYQRRRHAAPSTAIFVVDASGSTALDRLGETKGAIEQLLARCYVRRDEVALIAFRALGAELLLPPTRSLAAAKRRLSGLPGGGPTPLAAGLKKGLELALSVRRRGNTPLVVVMTDGAGNIALDGEADRVLAGKQAEEIARLYRAQAVSAICVDIARRPRPAVATLAASLGADLHVLRQAEASRLSSLVQTAMEAGRP